MKFNRKWVKWGAGVLALIVCIYAAVQVFGMIQYRREIDKMSPAKTGEIVPGVFAIQTDHVNAFLVEGEDGYLMIDAGNNYEQLLDGMNKLGIDPGEIAAILLTHSDSDHTAALGLFGSVPVYLLDNEVQMVNGTTSRGDSYNQLEHSYQILTDGQTSELAGLPVRVIATPGHTPGSASYYIDNQYLFTGDALALQDGKAAVFNSSFNMDDEQAKANIDKLAGMDLSGYLFTAHYGFAPNSSAALADWKEQ